MLASTGLTILIYPQRIVLLLYNTVDKIIMYEVTYEVIPLFPYNCNIKKALIKF